MKKYCIFSAQYLPNIGGVERYTYYIAKKIVEAGDKATIVTSYRKGEPIHEIKDGIEIYRVPCFSLMNGRFPVLKPCSNLIKIKRSLELKEFDLVIVNTRFYLHSLYGMRFAKKNKIKCITIEHGTSHLTFNNKYLDKLEHIYEHVITFFDKFYCRDYYGVSQACCEWSGHFGIKSKGVLYNAVDIREIEALMEEPVTDYKSEYDIHEDDVVISYTGRLLREKGIPQLLEVVKNLKYDKLILLFLAGDGPLDDVVRLVVEECNDGVRKNKIIPLGRIDFPHVAALLKITDIFCLPSDSEGFPTSVLEAAAAKCFIITTHNGGAKELLKGKEYGIIMPDNRIQTLEDSISLALKDEAYRKGAVEKTYEALKREFTFDATFGKIREIADSAGN